MNRGLPEYELMENERKIEFFHFTILKRLLKTTVDIVPCVWMKMLRTCSRMTGQSGLTILKRRRQESMSGE